MASRAVGSGCWDLHDLSMRSHCWVWRNREQGSLFLLDFEPFSLCSGEKNKKECMLYSRFQFLKLIFYIYLKVLLVNDPQQFEIPY